MTTEPQVAELLPQCRWPELPARYDQALREAVAFILHRIPDVVGIIASGTIVRGVPSASSDLDMYVIRKAPRRQRIQRFFNGVPAEIFVNPAQQVLMYLAAERAEARPVTAHMLASGFLILALDDTLADLRARAVAILSGAPDLGPEALISARYMAAARFEDALDVVEARPETAVLILTLAVFHMLHYRFLQANRYLPRDKDLLVCTDELDPHLGHCARNYFTAAALDDKLRWAREIADLTIATYGFFEWESTPQDLD